MTTDEKCAAWRGKYAERSVKLRRLVAKLMGYNGYSKLSPEAIASITQPTENAILAIIYGLDDDLSSAY